ncbi:MAG TPA: hypothetical protein VFZ03_02550, partial [Dongiaceae bacterium]
MDRNHACTCGIFAIVLALAGCAKDDAKYVHSVPPLSGEARSRLGQVLLDVSAPAEPPNVPGVPLVPAITVGEAAGGAALAS